MNHSKFFFFFNRIFKLFLLITDVVQLAYVDVKIVNLKKYLRLGGFLLVKTNFYATPEPLEQFFSISLMVLLFFSGIIIYYN